MKRILFISLVFVTMVASLSATKLTEQILKGKGYYIEAAENPEKTKIARAYFEDLNRLHPEEPFVEVFLGSVYYLEARDAGFHLDKMKWANRGNKQFDAAVAHAPDNIFLRMDRGKNSLYLPAIMGRFKVAVEDFTFLGQTLPQMSDHEIYTAQGAALYLREGETEKAFAVRMRQFVLYYEGHMALKEKEEKKAAQCWKKVLKLDDTTQTAQAAQERLNRLNEKK